MIEVLDTPGSSPAAERHLGFAQALAAYPRLRLVAQVQGDWHPASVQRQLPAVLRAHRHYGGASEPGLGVDDIAQRLGLSRTQLYRKMKALLGTGVTDYLQSLHLTKARQLLLQADITVAEVAYQTVFSSPMYFATAFKAKYQVWPTEFRAPHILVRA